MNRTEVLTKLNGIFKDVFADDDLIISEDMSADDIEDWDSLTHITLIAEIEENFGMKFSMKEVIGMQNIREMVDIILRETA